MNLKTLLLLISCLLPLNGVLADELRTFELQARSAEELIPLIRPLAGENAGISGKGRYLFIRASWNKLEELDEIIRKLDTAARQLLISVYQGRLSAAQERALLLDANSASKSRPLRSTRTRSILDATHQLRVSEGGRAFIATGSAQAVPFTGFHAGPGGIYANQGTEYRNSLSGFHVLPRLHGERVSLEIHPFAEHPGEQQDSFDVQKAVTTVSGQLRQWIPLGGVTLEDSQHGRGILNRYATRGREENRILLKVELVQ